MAIASASDPRAPRSGAWVEDQSSEGISRPLITCGPACEQDEIPNLLMNQRGRVARTVAGFAWLAAGGLLATRALPGRIALWPASLVPTWFGISHLVAAVISYRGCPELGAIPTVLLGRPVPTVCEIWERIDRRIGGGTSATDDSKRTPITADSLAEMRALVPTCSLSPEGARVQRARYANAAASVVDIHREADRLEVCFSPSVDEQVLAELIETERNCCPFFEMSYDAARRALTVGVADPSQEPALDAVALGFGASV
jgi:hypothetical protein